MDLTTAQGTLAEIERETRGRRDLESWKIDSFWTGAAVSRPSATFVRSGWSMTIAPLAA
jgi:hypothetical protein